MLQRNFACLRLPASFHFANQRSVSISAHFRQQKTNEKEYAEQEKIDERLKEMKEQNFKTKHIGVMGGFFCVLFGSQAILLWKRRSEYQKANVKMPPIKFEKFCDEYLSKGIVKSIVYNQFGVLEVYFNNLTNKQETDKKITKFLSTFSTGPERFAPEPDLRVSFKGKLDSLEKAVLAVQQNMEGPSCVHIETNNYPTYKELAFVVGSAVFTAVCLMATVS